MHLNIRKYLPLLAPLIILLIVSVAFVGFVVYSKVNSPSKHKPQSDAEIIKNSQCQIVNAMLVPNTTITAGAPIMCGNDSRLISALAVNIDGKLKAHLLVEKDIVSTQAVNAVFNNSEMFILYEIHTRPSRQRLLCNTYYHLVKIDVKTKSVAFLPYRIQSCSSLPQLALKQPYLHVSIPDTSQMGLYIIHSYNLKTQKWSVD